MLKITRTEENERNVRLLLEGTITGPWATLLDEVCRDYLRQQKAIELDCARVDFVDAKGIAILKDFPQQQIALMSAPLFVKQLLDNGDPQ